MQRDLIGYSCDIPKVNWPHHARLALNFVLNYEEGSESNVLDGDAQSEHYLTDLPGVAPLKGERHLSVESLFEYGSRAGIWRLLRLFDEHHIPLTVFATGLALERNPVLAEILKESRHEHVQSHIFISFFQNSDFLYCIPWPLAPLRPGLSNPDPPGLSKSIR